MTLLKKLVVGLALLMPVAVCAQESEMGSFKDRLFFGGNFGLQFGNQTFVDISPLVGYRITERLHAGIGATYIYYRYKDAYLKFETSVYGGRVFGRYFILENLFAHSEVEVLNLEVPAPVSNFQDVYVRENITNVLVGGGYAQQLGSNVQLVLMLLYNLTEEQYTPYQNPIIRIGINAGF